MLSAKLQTLCIFFQFFRRDLYVNLKQIKHNLINYALIYPASFGINFAYFQSNIFFGANNEHLGTIIFAGTCIIPIVILTSHFTLALLFDLENDRYIDYQITILHPRFVILERILFSSIYTFMISIPYFPVAKLMLGSAIDTTHTSWPCLFLMLYLGTLCCSTYQQLAACLLKQNQITMFWVRVNHVLIMLGGFWIPLHTVRSYSPFLSYLTQLNPLIYLSEGMRQAIVGGEQFLSITHCAIALLIFSGIFTILTWHVFKKRVDHI